MEKILIDTDVIIDFLRGYHKRIKTVFDKIEKKEIKAYIALLTIAELYSGKDSENKEREIILNQLLSFFEIIPLDYTLCKQAGSLKRKYGLGLVDSIIAATSIKNKMKLFTFNINHFKNLPNLALCSV